MKAPESLTIPEQMQVLQSREDIATWSLAHLGLPSAWRDTNEEGNTGHCQNAIHQLFTLTRADIEASLATQGLQPEDLPPTLTQPGSRDGSYFITKGKTEWEYYFQERECRWPTATFNDLREARKLLLNQWIPIWLDHLRVPCRTKEGKVTETL